MLQKADMDTPIGIAYTLVNFIQKQYSDNTWIVVSNETND
jgi:hypothetical protein